MFDITEPRGREGPGGEGGGGGKTGVRRRNRRADDEPASVAGAWEGVATSSLKADVFTPSLEASAKATREGSSCYR